MTRYLKYRLFAALALVLFAAPLRAQSHRARLSHDLADRLDRRIESVTDVIVSGADTTIDQLVVRYGVRLKKRMHGGAVLEATGGQIDALSQDPDVDHLAGDVPVYRQDEVTVESTGADQVWAGLDRVRAITGRGVGVAVIDSGVSPHSALAGRVVAAVDFTTPGGSALDQYGHGTHVAGIIAESGTDGYPGMAPGASLIDLRVLGADGSGATSDVINAIDWAIDHRHQFNIGVINLSLGHPVLESYRDDPLCQAAQRAVDAGIVVVAAVGNFGKTDDGRPIVGGVIAPANTPAVVTVGALNTMGTPARSDDVMATYSSRGPTPIDGVLKPDLVAPGNKIVSAAAAGSYLAAAFPDRLVDGGAYITLSGTSMATAVVSGAAALLLEARPDLTPGQVKAALQLTSSAVPGAGLIEAGAGSLDVAAAVEVVEGHNSSLPMVSIANELVRPNGFAYSALILNGERTQSQILVWGNTVAVVWGSAQPQQIDYWGSGIQPDILVWGNQQVLPDILVWGNSVTSDILVWGNILVWGDSQVASDILVWGNEAPGTVNLAAETSVSPDILVWGN